MSHIDEKWNKKDRMKLRFSLTRFFDLLRWQPALKKTQGKIMVDMYGWGHFILHLLTIVFIIFVVIHFQSSSGSDFLKRFDKRLAKLNKKSAITPVDISQKVALGPVDDYLIDLGDKNLFQFPWEAPVSEVIDKMTSIELSHKLRLVGIYLDGDPQVIIEDIKKTETYFLSIGENIENAQLHEIAEDRAIFIFNGKKVELVL